MKIFNRIYFIFIYLNEKIDCKKIFEGKSYDAHI